MKSKRTTRVKTAKARPKAKPVKKAIASSRSKKAVNTLPDITKMTPGTNRLIKSLEKASFRNKKTLQSTIRKGNFKAVELAPAFSHVYKKSHQDAVKLAESYANDLPDLQQHRELFQDAVYLKKDERKALITGYRKAGQARGVVQAISQLPRGFGRVIMKDFVGDKKNIDRSAVDEVLFWLRDAGLELQRLKAQGKKTIAPQHEDMDSAVVEFFEDLADDIVNAITAVVDAIGDTLESLGAAIVNVVNWAADAVAGLVEALLAAHKTIFDLISAAVETGYELVKKIIAGITAVGKAMFEVLDAAVDLAKDAFKTVLRAIDQLGRQLSEFVSWLASKTFSVIKKAVEALIEIGKSIGNILEKALAFGFSLVKGFVQALLEIGKTIGEILVTAITRPSALFDTIIKSFMDLGRTLGNIIDNVVSAGINLVREVVNAAVRIGTAIIEFTKYLATAALDVATKVLDGLLQAGKTLVDVITTIASHAINAVKKVVQAFLNLGKTMLNLVKDVLNIGMNLLKQVLKAAFELGKTILEFTRTLVEFTYKTAARLIDAALQIGKTVAEILDSVAGATYYIFRKIVNGILQALGPVGAVLDWLISRGEDLASALWREAILACRFVKKSISEVLTWAAQQTMSVFEKIIQLVENVGAAVTEIIDWAITIGDEMLEQLAGMWERLGNSVIYALNYLEKDFIPGVAKFIKGALNAGFKLAKLVAWTVGKAFEVVLEVVRGALAAGVTLAQLIVETAIHPDQAMDNLMKAARQLGQTMKQIVQSVVDAGEAFLDEFIRAMVSIGEDIVQMLEGILEVAGGLLDTAVFILMEMLNSFRHLTAAERADATLIFGDIIDFNNVYIATESPTNSIIFGIQDFFTGNPQSRAFVTGNLINFDADDGAIRRSSLIHEMTHVWQNQNVGPVYMAHAIASQFGAGYNYGYTEGSTITINNGDYAGNSFNDASGRIDGQGGEAALDAADGDFMSFNPEQQGQITMHYFVRRYLQMRPPAEYEAWQPYVDYVQENRPDAA